MKICVLYVCNSDLIEFSAMWVSLINRKEIGEHFSVYNLEYIIFYIGDSEWYCLCILCCNKTSWAVYWFSFYFLFTMLFCKKETSYFFLWIINLKKFVKWTDWNSNINIAMKEFNYPNKSQNKPKICLDNWKLFS